MTVETTDVSAGPYPTDGIATAFRFSFKALSADEVRVEIDGSIVPASSYVVQIAAQSGTVLFDTPPSSGGSLYVRSDPDFRQGISFSNQSAFLPSSHNEANDRAAVRDQVLKDGLNRAFQVPIEGGVDGMFPVVLPGGGTGFASGTGTDAALRTDLAGSNAGSSIVAFKQSGIGASVRTAESKLREVEKSITDYGTGNDWRALVNAAVAALGTVSPIRLVTPPGAWTTGARDYSDFRNITFVIRPGAQINNGANAVKLPERVEIGLGAGFTGTGAVTQKNKDVMVLAVPPSGYAPFGNDARGVGALVSIIGGHNNTAWGLNALRAATYTRFNMGIGARTVMSEVGDITGARAMVSPNEIGSYVADGDAMLGIADSALMMSKGGVESVAIGMYALRQHPASRWNIAIGPQGMESATGNFNIGLGAYTFVSMQGSNSLAIGWAAGEGQINGSIIAIGHAAMSGSRTGDTTITIGILGLLTASAPKTTVAIGQEVGKNLAGIVGGTLVGAFALGSSTGSIINPTFVGLNAGLNCGADECTGIGAGALSANEHYSNCTGLGGNTQATANNQVILGDERSTPVAAAPLQVRSDARDKTDVRDTVLGLDFILALRAVDYRWNKREYYRAPLPDPYPEPAPTKPRKPVNPVKPTAPTGNTPEADEARTKHADMLTKYNAALQWYAMASEAFEADNARYETAKATYDAAKAHYDETVMAPALEANKLANITAGTAMTRTRYHHGLIAQDVQDIINATGIDFGGFQDHSMTGGDDVLSLGYEELIAPLVKSIQTLTARIVALEGVIGRPRDPDTGRFMAREG